MNNSIIAPQLKKQKLKLKDNFTLVDLVFTLIYATTAFLIGYNLIFLSMSIRIIIGISVFMFLMLTLINSERYNAKIYMIAIRGFIFWSKKKKFSIDSKSNNTSLLMPYRKLYDGYIETSVLEGGKKWYISALEIKGINITTLDPEEQILKLEQLSNMFRLTDCQLSLVKIERPHNLNKNLKFLQTVMNKLEHLKKSKKLSKHGYDSRTKQLEGYQNLYSDQEGILGYSQTAKTFILFIYETEVSKLFKAVKLIKNKINEINLRAEEISKYELVNNIKLIFNPYDEPFSNEKIDEYNNKLNELLAIDNITFTQNNFKINDVYYSTKGIRDYPIYPQNGWAAKLCATDSTVIINIAKTNLDAVKEQLHRAMVNARTNLFSIKRTVNRSEKENEYQSFENLVNLISCGEETIKRVNVLFLNYGVDKKTLKQAEEGVEMLLKQQNMKMDYLLFKQIDGYSGILPKPTDPTAYTNSFEMPCVTIGNSFPFLNNALEDEKGLFVGYNSTGDVVFSDQFKRGGDYQNSNAFFIGTTGGGKTTTVSKFLNYHIALGRKVIIIDPKREFGHLCNYHDGNWIDAGSGTKGNFNPLQIQTPVDKSISIEMIIGDHLQILETFFRFTEPSFNEEEIKFLLQKILDFYLSLKVNKSNNIIKMKNNDWPIFSDLVIFLKEQIPNLGEEILLNKIIKTIEYDFTGYGKYAALWNKQSSVSLANNLLNVLDIQTLYSKSQSNVLKAQMFLMLNFIRNEINNNRFNDNNEIILAVDEAHVVIDRDNPQALKFLFETVKMIRGFNGGVMLVTQNLSDFKTTPELEREATAILNNAQYVGILKLKQKDLQDVSDLYQASGGLSSAEINFCATAQRGDMLFMATDYNRHCLHVELTEIEQEAIGIKLTEN
ncbi:Mbov_0397 family ICE element conjugal transfer ATPase [Spiroplasma chrysopicola]|uniref:Transfer complex protein TrsE n=1 Tax=Spiroplasma chrysopicola DF-1 TaxID=1276227 RepID=R4UJL0_9MOLU|nr:ATP-binding protein [Spiroplasma chrysopicola]AGM25496.1 transfer complex protein TrsE [Spiroplasma chrysopicola DF-1]